MAQEAWRAYLELALGATEATRKKATKTVKRLAGKSAVSAEQLQSMVEDLLRTSSTNRDALTKLVRYELERALSAVGLATAEEVAALTARVRDLETKQRAASAPVPAVSAPVPAAGPAKVAKKAVKKAMPGRIYDDGEPLAGGGDVELGASEPAAPPVVKKTVARKRVANTTAPATTAAVAEAAPTKAAPSKAAPAAKAAPAKATPTKRTTSTRRPPAKKATS